MFIRILNTKLTSEIAAMLLIPASKKYLNEFKNFHEYAVGSQHSRLMPKVIKVYYVLLILWKLGIFSLINR